MKLPIKFSAAITAGLLLAASAGKAHDYWIEVTPFNTPNPQTVDITLNVGNDMVGDTQPNIADWYRDFSYVHAGKRRDVPGRTGDDPAGRLSVVEPGLYLVGYENHPDFSVLEAERFHQYLRQEGLEWVIDQREAEGIAETAVGELYQRCAKALLRVGNLEPSTQELRRKFGYRLEIVPQNSPYSADRLRLQVLFEGEPVEGLLVVAFSRQAPSRHSLGRTDGQGMTEVDIGDPGTWMIKTVHIQPYQGSKADWISYWGSLTFERR